MNSKWSSIVGVVCAVLCAVAFASVSYASPLVEEHGAKPVHVVRNQHGVHVDAPVSLDANAPREKAAPQMKRVSTYSDPFKRANRRCDREVLKFGAPSTVVFCR